MSLWGLVIADLHLAVTHCFIQHVINDASDRVGYCLRYFSPFDAVRSHLCHAQCAGACQTHWHTWDALGYERILHHILKPGVASMANHVHYFPWGEISSEETCSCQAGIFVWLVSLSPQRSTSLQWLQQIHPFSLNGAVLFLGTPPWK